MVIASNDKGGNFVYSLSIIISLSDDINCLLFLKRNIPLTLFKNTKQDNQTEGNKRLLTNEIMSGALFFLDMLFDSDTRDEDD